MGTGPHEALFFNRNHEPRTMPPKHPFRLRVASHCSHSAQEQGRCLAEHAAPRRARAWALWWSEQQDIFEGSSWMPVFPAALRRLLLPAAESFSCLATAQTSGRCGAGAWKRSAVKREGPPDGINAGCAGGGRLSACPVLLLPGRRCRKEGVAGRFQVHGLQGQDCGTLQLVRRGQYLSMNQRSCVRPRGGGLALLCS